MIDACKNPLSALLVEIYFAGVEIRLLVFENQDDRFIVLLLLGRDF